MKAQVEALLLQLLVLAEELVALAVVVVHDVRLYAEDRLYALLPRLVVEGLRGKHVAVVRDGKRGHAERLRLGDERHDAALPVEQRISGVEVEMCEPAHVGSYYIKIPRTLDRAHNNPRNIVEFWAQWLAVAKMAQQQKLTVDALNATTPPIAMKPHMTRQGF